MFIKIFIPTILVGSILFLSSCVNAKKAVYFSESSNTRFRIEAEMAEEKIMPNDILSISVSSLNPEATEVFNTPNTPSSNNATATATTTQTTGYLVNTAGYIQFPIIGNLMAAGLTKNSLKEELTKTLIDRKLLMDPIVDIRYLNYRVTVLGEVARPTVVTVPSEKISLLEALGLAGDLTIYARRDNVMIIREENGERVITRINLNADDLFNSPYYFLKSNDIVYVEPGKTKVASTSRVNLWLPVVFSIMSFGIIAVDRINR